MNAFLQLLSASGFDRQTFCLAQRHKNKSQRGHSVGPPRPIHRVGN